MENAEETNTEEIKNEIVAEVDEYAVSLKSRLSRLAVSLTVVAGIVTGFVFLIRLVGFEVFGGAEAAQYAADQLTTYGVWIFFIFYFMYITQAVFLNFIPGTITFFLTIGYFLFGQNFGLTVAVGIVSALSASLVVYSIGRFGGRKLLYWLFGRKHVENKLDWFQRRGIFYVPALYIVPFMTGDLICLVCGASKVKLWKFLLLIVLCRPIEITLAVLYIDAGINIMRILSPLEMFLLINLMILNVILFVAYYHKIVSTLKRFLGIIPKVVTTKDLAEKEELKNDTKNN